MLKLLTGLLEVAFAQAKVNKEIKISDECDYSTRRSKKKFNGFAKKT